MGRPFVKEFVEERDLTIYILFDVSASGDFSSTTKSKRETATEIGASIAFSAIRNNDQVALALVSGGIERYIPPKKGKKHVLRLIKEMLSYNPENRTTDLLAAITALSRIKRRGIVFIISDFIIDDPKAMEQPLKTLRNRHEVIAVDLSDKREQDIPDVGWIWLEDCETGEQVMVNTSDADFRKEFVKTAQKRRHEIREIMENAGIDYAWVNTAYGWERPLLQAMSRRRGAG